MSTSDANGFITYVNQKFCDISKYSTEELIGKTYGFMNQNYSEESTILQIRNEVLKNKVSHHKIKSHAKEWERLWIQAVIVACF